MHALFNSDQLGRLSTEAIRGSAIEVQLALKISEMFGLLILKYMRKS